MPDNLRIGKQLEKSTTKGSIVVTDSSNEQYYLPPGTAGQIIEAYNSGGGVIQLRYVTPVAGTTVTKTPFSGVTSVVINHALGRVMFFQIYNGSNENITYAGAIVDDETTATITFSIAQTGIVTWY